MTSATRGEKVGLPARQTTQAALVLATLAVGRSTLAGITASGPLGPFVEACRGFGAVIREEAGDIVVQGVGIGGLVGPAGVVGTPADSFAAALLAGMAAGHEPGAIVAMTPEAAAEVGPVLVACGAGLMAPPAHSGAFEVRAARDPLPVEHRGPCGPLAAVAALVAGLNAPGTTTVVTEGGAPARLVEVMRLFGADLSATRDCAAETLVLRGRPELQPARIPISDLTASVGGAP